MKYGERHEMPQRRMLETRLFTFFDGIREYFFSLGIGRRPDLSVGEVFMNIGKDGAILGAMSHDSAVLASLAMQYGCPLDAIRAALLRNPNGTAAGPIGAVLDMIAEQEAQRLAGAPDVEAPARDHAADRRAALADHVRPLVEAVLSAAEA